MVENKVLFDPDIITDGLPWNIKKYDMKNLILFREHWHKNPEIIYVVNGKLEILVNGKLNVVTAGQVIFFNSCEIHGNINGDNCKYYAIHLDYNYLKSHIPFFENVNLNNKCFDEYVISLIKDFLNEEMKVNAQKLHSQILFDYIVSRLYESCITDNANQCRSNHTIVVAILHYLKKYCKEPFDSKNMCKQFHLSYEYMARLVKKETGKTILDNLNDMRTELAIIDLQQNIYSIEEIANRLGYFNVKSFEKAFRTRLGMTPKQYQKKTKRV